MRIKSFQIRSFGPIEVVHVEDLADVVVFAGPNGVGKTSTNTALLNLARNAQPSADTWMIVEATSADERTRWNKAALDTRIQAEASLLQQTLHRSRRRNKYHGSFLNFDSDRAVRNVQQYAFQWDIGDPLMEEIGWDSGWHPMFNRYNDVRHSLFRMVIEGKCVRLPRHGIARLTCPRVCP
jgi:hypothetical protein